MQPNFIIRTNYFKVSRTVRHNVMAKETVSVPRGLEIERRETDSKKERERERNRGKRWDKGEGIARRTPRRT